MRVELGARYGQDAMIDVANYLVQNFGYAKRSDDKIISMESDMSENDGYAVPDNGEEIRTVSSTGGEKGVKLERYDLIPTPALAVLARHYGVGAQKYAEHNWRKGYEWSKSYAALQRHANAFWNGEDIDEETGSSHMAAVAFHAFALLTFIEEQPDFDDRFKSVRVEKKR